MSYKVLIADDVTDVRSLLRLIVEHDPNFEVVAEAENGAQAALLATAHQPDLVISDMDMPVHDGLYAIKQIRGTCVDTRIIVLSGFALYSKSDAYEAGADICVEKSGEAFGHVVSMAHELLEIDPAGEATVSAVSA
jgi:DNA-binding NarL/FixJ family response regulator